MAKAKVMFIPNHNKMECWGCKEYGGHGYIIKNGHMRECRLCGGSECFIDKNYTIIYTDKNGQKHGFMVDSIK